MYYSQFGQDKYLNEEIFHHKKNGIFIDVGAYDGIMISNTYFFEKELDWIGICIEPHPKNFEKLSNNRKSINLNCCVSDTSQNVEFWEINCPHMDVFSGIYNKYDSRHKEYIMNRINSLKEEERIFQIHDVKCRTLNDIFLEYKYDKIDFLGIDTEGNELDVLKGVDFTKTNIDTILVENNFIKIDKKSPCGDFLKQYGYKLIKQLDIDEIYRR